MREFGMLFLLVNLTAGLSSPVLWPQVMATQEKPPKTDGATPPASGPTMEQTLAFINKMLAEQGPVITKVIASGTPLGQYTDTFYPVTASTPCIFLGRHTVSSTGTAAASRDETLDVKLSTVDPRSVQIKPYDEWLNSVAPSVGPFSVSPARFVITLRQPVNDLPVTVEDGVTVRHDRQPMMAIFSDQSTAERVAKAYIHAAALCGGGNDSPF